MIRLFIERFKQPYEWPGKQTSRVSRSRHKVSVLTSKFSNAWWTGSLLYQSSTYPVLIPLLACELMLRSCSKSVWLEYLHGETRFTCVSSQRRSTLNPRRAHSNFHSQIVYQTHRADCYASTKKSISVPMIHLPWVPGLNYYERWMQTIAGVLLPTRIISRTLVRSLEDSPNTH